MYNNRQELRMNVYSLQKMSIFDRPDILIDQTWWSTRDVDRPDMLIDQTYCSTRRFTCVITSCKTRDRPRRGRAASSPIDADHAIDREEIEREREIWLMCCRAWCSRTPLYSESVALHNVQTCAAGHDARVHISIHYMCAGHNARTLSTSMAIQCPLARICRYKFLLHITRLNMHCESNRLC